MTGLDPTKYESDFGELTLCPFVKLLNIATKWEADDFDRMTLLEIGDVSNLLKALFKVNLHIAHSEYFLKKDLPGQSDWWYGYNEDGRKWISFEPTVEFKFSNFHAANQPSESGDLMCCAEWEDGAERSITPVNRDLLNDNGAIHYSDDKYCYDYHKTLRRLDDVCEDDSNDPSKEVDSSQKYYRIEPLHLYGNSQLQSPTDVNDFVRQRLGVIERTTSQVSTFTSIVKKYRPVVMPNVRDIFNKCINNFTKY